jgi:glyoxylase-like metal-dependent hydrolase (beta-lactamase superfamily II)
MLNTASDLHIFHPIADTRIWAFRYKTTVTAFAVVSARYVVLLDTLVNAATATAMVDALGEPLATRQLLVVNTHADWDHCWGNMVFVGPQATHPAPIIGQRLCRERILSDQARAGLAQKQAQDAQTFGSVELAPTTLTFDGALAIHGGDLTFELIYTPGHTADHISIFVHELRTLFPGDAAEAPLPFVPDATALSQLRASLDQLRALEAETVLYCHADSHRADVIEQNIAYFDELERRVRTVGARHVVSLHDDLEALVGFPFDEVAGVAELTEEARAFYRPAHHAAIRAMVEYVQGVDG